MEHVLRPTMDLSSYERKRNHLFDEVRAMQKNNQWDQLLGRFEKEAFPEIAGQNVERAALETEVALEMVREGLKATRVDLAEANDAENKRFLKEIEKFLLHLVRELEKYHGDFGAGDFGNEEYFRKLAYELHKLYRTQIALYSETNSDDKIGSVIDSGMVTSKTVH